MIKNIKIPAIHDKDLKNVLGKFGATEKIDSKEIICSNCNEVITWENLFAFRITSEGLIFFCNEPDCIEKTKMP